MDHIGNPRPVRERRCARYGEDTIPKPGGLEALLPATGIEQHSIDFGRYSSQIEGGATAVRLIAQSQLTDPCRTSMMAVSLRVMKILGGNREHRAGDPNCRFCDSPDGKHWPQPHNDGVIVKDCAGLVHCEEVPSSGSSLASSVLYRCDVCGDAI